MKCAAAIHVPSKSTTSFPYGLGKSGLHELAEASYGDAPAMTGFLLAAMRKQTRGAWVWVRQTSIARDMGEVSEALQAGGSACLRLNVQASNIREALWATEEAILSGAANLVIAEIEGTDFTASRRLTLASGRHGVPVVLMLPYTCEGATAADTRWRVGSLPSSPGRFDKHAPGYPRWRAVLERCRTSPASTGQAFDLEWNDETLSLSVVSGLAAGSAAPRPEVREPALRHKAG